MQKCMFCGKSGEQQLLNVAYIATQQLFLHVHVCGEVWRLLSLSHLVDLWFKWHMRKTCVPVVLYFP